MKTRMISWVLLVAALVGFFPAAVFADAKPYFKVYSGDVFAGGWFDNGATSCSTGDSNYQAPTFSPLKNQYRGGVLAFATSSRLGSSTDFGVFAMGLIEGSAGTQYGFYSGVSGVSSASFSNTNNASGSYWGGYFAGAVPQIHCIPDYYTTKQHSPTNLGTASSVNLNSLNSGQYIVTPIGSSVNISPANISVSAGKALTVFINGNAYISKNIQYANNYTSDNAPKLAIIAKGNIYIGPSVSRIDGLYIAQPTSGATAGNIWTCHDSTTTDPSGYWIGSNCANKLTVNGAMIAKQVVFTRVKGALASASSNEGAGSANIAEVINYIPAMVIGGPFFNLPPGNTATIDSLISLPPVF